MQGILDFAANDRVLYKNGKWHTKVTTKCVRHSYPKMKLARRILSIPHPRNQIFLALEIEKHWPELLTLCKRSTISLTTPKLSAKRALEGSYERRAEGVERAIRSVGQRYVVHADLARFYPSIYTHSIPWSIHGKSFRNDRGNDLYGNLIDLWVRQTQSAQTGGLPVGPDTSYLIAEMIASGIDHELGNAVGSLRGTRYIDDYHLYFSSRFKAEKALSELHKISSVYELDINDLKTSIQEIPESMEPDWKTQLRCVHLVARDHSTSFKAIFDLASSLAASFPQDGVFTYLAKKINAVVGKLDLGESDWLILESLLLRSAVGEPAALPTILRIFEEHHRVPESAAAALNSICIHHSGLQQSSEVAWAMWSAKRLGTALSEEAAAAVAMVDDDIVALVALDLRENHLLPTPSGGFAAWSSHMTTEGLYSEHWLLAYEASVKDWLPSVTGQDYVTNDPYFSLLRDSGVSFYDTSDVEMPDEGGYEEEDDYEDDDEDDEEDDEDPKLPSMNLFGGQL